MDKEYRDKEETLSEEIKKDENSHKIEVNNLQEIIRTLEQDLDELLIKQYL